VYAAATQNPRGAGTQFDRQAVDSLDELIIFP
jgi:hypothetical protein